MCFAENPHGIATSNSVFVRQSILNNFKVNFCLLLVRYLLIFLTYNLQEEPPKTKTVEEGQPFTLPCDGPDGWPKPAIFWMIQVTFNFLKGELLPYLLTFKGVKACRLLHFCINFVLIKLSN